MREDFVRIVLAGLLGICPQQRETDRVFQYWDDILRFIATIKLKETTASDLCGSLSCQLAKSNPIEIVAKVS